MERVGEKWTARCALPKHEDRSPSFVDPGDLPTADRREWEEPTAAVAAERSDKRMTSPRRVGAEGRGTSYGPV